MAVGSLLVEVSLSLSLSPSISKVAIVGSGPAGLGLATALADSGVTVWTPSELYGPRGLSGPMIRAISLLASCAGKPVHRATINNNLAELVIGSLHITANLTNQPFGGLAPFGFKTS